MWLTYTVFAILAFGVGATMQKHGMATEFPNLSFGRLWLDLGRIVRTLFSNWVWLVGLVFNLLACVLMTLAIDVGEISVVQPLMNISLIVSIAIGVIVLRERLCTQEWLGAFTLIAGSALVSASGVQMADGTNMMPQAQPDVLALLWIFAGCAAAVGLLVGLGRATRKGLPPELTLAVIAGLFFGLTGVTVKLTTIYVGQIGTTQVFEGVGDWLVVVMSEPAAWAAIVVSIAGFVFFQIAFSHGRVAVVVPVTTIAAMVPPIASGIFAFDEAVGALRISGIVVVTVGVALLLVRPATSEEDPL
jgi:drug/metabolite transporter (DMT)-like permease